MSNEIKRIDIREFREAGYLQEVNRQFLHPLGLALEVVLEDDGSEHLGGIWDYRDDPEGMNYGANMLSKEKADRITAERVKKTLSRMEQLGYVVQPVDG